MTPEEQGTQIRRDREALESQRSGSAPGAPSRSEVETLRVEIEQTRNDMTDTVEAIEQRLDPEQLTDQAKDAAKEITDYAVREATERAKQTMLEVTAEAKSAIKEITDHALGEAKEAIREMAGQAGDAVREATIGRVENMVHSVGETANQAQASIVDVVRRNPVAAALTGLGLGWLYMSSRSSSPRPMTSFGRTYPTSGYAASSGRPSSYGPGDPLGEARYGEEQSAMRGALDRAQDAAEGVAQQAQDVARGAGNTASDFGSGVVETVRLNPIPAVLAGVSLGWLFMNRPGQTSAPIQEAQHRAGHVARQLRDVTDQVADNVQSTAGDLTDRLGETTGRIADQVQDTVGDLSSGIQSQANRGRHRFEEMLSEHPLAVGAAALALGMVAGLPAPQSSQEHQLMGHASSAVIDRAQSAAQDTLQKVQRVASEVQDTAQREAKQQGLAS